MHRLPFTIHPGLIHSLSLTYAAYGLCHLCIYNFHPPLPPSRFFLPSTGVGSILSGPSSTRVSIISTPFQSQLQLRRNSPIGRHSAFERRQIDRGHRPVKPLGVLFDGLTI